jgi:hypothetical protein
VVQENDPFSLLATVPKGEAERQLPDRKADDPAECRGAQLALSRQCRLCDPIADIRGINREWRPWVVSSH